MLLDQVSQALNHHQSGRGQYKSAHGVCVCSTGMALQNELLSVAIQHVKRYITPNA